MKPNFQKTELKRRAVDILYIMTGCIIMAIAFNVFQRPNDIVGGGITGISQVINHFTNLPIGVVSFVLNLPLFYFGLKWLPKVSILMTIFTTTFLAFCYDMATWLPAFTGDKLFAAILAGVLGGIGGGLVFMRGSTSGGTDLLNQLIRTKKKGMSVGSLYLIINACVIIMATLVYGELESAFYAIATLYSGSIMIDKMINGMDFAKMVFVITNKGDEIADAITKSMVRGVTIIDGTGAYSKEERKVLLCVVRRNEIYQLRTFVRNVDPESFMVFTDASEVWGQGFKLKEVI